MNINDLLIDYFYNEIGSLENMYNNYGGVLSDDYYDYVSNRIRYLKLWLSYDVYYKSFRFYKNLNARRNRLYKKLLSMNKVNDLIFVTLTFTNEFINYKESSLHQFVKIFLNGLGCDYVANKDYGEKFGRLHYHAVVNCDSIDLNTWVYGSINVERIRCSKDNVYRISNYVLKFVNHSFKDSTNKYVMYSRKKKGCKI